MKITALEIENVKAVKAVRLEPSANGLTVIGGRNGQGKTSILDAIAFALGGAAKKPTNLKRDGSVNDPYIHIETDDGLVVERKGKNSSLTVTDSTGRKGGQALLDGIVGKLAIDLPRFMDSSPADKARTLLDILGIGDKLAKLDAEEKAKYDTRHLVGQQKDLKRKAADDMPYHEDVPDEPLSITDLIAEQQSILARNGMRTERWEAVRRIEGKVSALESQIGQLKDMLDAERKSLDAARDMAIGCGDEIPTDEIREKISNFEAINIKVAENKAKMDREAEASALEDQYDNLTEEIDVIRAERMKLLEGADLPLPGLSVVDGELCLNGKAWDCMSGSQQLIVACAIVSKLSPECKFVLMDKLEQLDVETMKEFGKWLEDHDLQCIATRVSTGDECTIVISDGEVKEDEFADEGY